METRNDGADATRKVPGGRSITVRSAVRHLARAVRANLGADAEMEERRMGVATLWAAAEAMLGGDLAEAETLLGELALEHVTTALDSEDRARKFLADADAVLILTYSRWAVLGTARREEQAGGAHSWPGAGGGGDGGPLAGLARALGGMAQVRGLDSMPAHVRRSLIAELQAVEARASVPGGDGGNLH